MKLFLSILLTPLFYVVFGISLGMFHIVQVIAFNFFGYRAHKKSVDILNWFLILSVRLVGTKIKYVGFKDIPRDHPIVFLANHQGAFDIPPLIWKLRKYHMKFIAKKELSNGVPSISYNLKHGGSAIIDRSKPELAKQEIRKFSSYLSRNNYAVLIFPEGTRSRAGEMKMFKIGGIETILKNIPNALFVPIAIKDVWKFSKYGVFPKSFGEKVSFTMLRPRNLTLRNLKQDVEKIQEEIREILNQE